jgi:hypothetical protein
MWTLNEVPQSQDTSRTIHCPFLVPLWNVRLKVHTLLHFQKLDLYFYIHRLFTMPSLFVISLTFVYRSLLFICPLFLHWSSHEPGVCVSPVLYYWHWSSHEPGVCVSPVLYYWHWSSHEPGVCVSPVLYYWHWSSHDPGVCVSPVLYYCSLFLHWCVSPVLWFVFFPSGFMRYDCMCL